MAFHLASRLQASSRRLLAWFVVAAIVPAGALAVLGWFVAEQARAAEAERRRVDREQFATLSLESRPTPLPSILTWRSPCSTGRSSWRAMD
jgi:hypothetical protein